MTYRAIHSIASEISRLWRYSTNNNYYKKDAKPYLDAMMGITTIRDKVGLDSGRDIVNRFLCNVGGWRGPEARRIKAELREMLK